MSSLFQMSSQMGSASTTNWDKLELINPLQTCKTADQDELSHSSMLHFSTRIFNMPQKICKWPCPSSKVHSSLWCWIEQWACRYITVDEEAGRALFYAFVESSGNPKEDPVVLWLNGWHPLILPPYTLLSFTQHCIWTCESSGFFQECNAMTRRWIPWVKNSVWACLQTLFPACKESRGALIKT